MKNSIRIDAGRDQFVVQFARHRENQAVLDYRILGVAWELAKVAAPRLGDAFLPLVVGQLGWCGACSVCIGPNQVVQESARVNLAECFFRGIVGELLDLPRDLWFRIQRLPRGDLSLRDFVEIIEVQPTAPRRLVSEDDPVLHTLSSRRSRKRSSLRSMRSMALGSILSFVETA